MNKKQKILTGVALLIFLWLGIILGMAPPRDGFGAVFTAWFALGVVYAGLFFILGPSK